MRELPVCDLCQGSGGAYRKRPGMFNFEYERVPCPNGCPERLRVTSPMSRGLAVLWLVGHDNERPGPGCDCPACPCHRQDAESREKFAWMQRGGWRWRYDAWTRTHTLEAPQPRPGGRGFINCSWHGSLEVEYGTYECPRCVARRALEERR